LPERPAPDEVELGTVVRPESGAVPTTCVGFCIWQVTAERSQIDPLITETAGEATGLVDSAAARFSSRPPQLASAGENSTLVKLFCGYVGH
jgi:hypothetical protein